MEDKKGCIKFYVSEGQRERILSLSHELGVSVSELVTRALGAYLEAEQRGRQVTAVTFGGWLLVYHDLSGIEAVLRECAQQISATRHVVTMLADRGALTERRATDMVSVLQSCREEVVEARGELSGCIAQVEKMRDAWVATDYAGVPVNSPLAGA